MFGIGGSELLVILVVALLFLGPDKLPQAAKTISKGIRDLKKQSRSLQQQIESDEQIGGAIRDLKSALRGEESLPARSIRPPRPALDKAAEPVITGAITGPALTGGDGLGEAKPVELTEIEEPKLTLPASASSDDDAELASLVKPASGTVAKGT